jgi:hypothetical protein
MPNLSLKETKKNQITNKRKSDDILRDNLTNLIDNKKPNVDDIKNIADSEYSEVKTYETLPEIGPRLKNAYEAGQLPATHRVLYDSIVKELSDRSEGMVKIQHLLVKTRISRNAAGVILKCLQKYGYIQFQVQKRRSEGTFIRLLKI